MKIMWAIFKEFRTLTESDEPADPVRELWPRRSGGARF
ncbi:hypothetical protein ABID21_000158 [Pseudorhizobium tarimense]|uniref:Uncharacterized protein n=1 Tax=Pseudorhizobium tarimense TaxID=1079109 RepID=A0ABV2H0K7_9HYPH